MVVPIRIPSIRQIYLFTNYYYYYYYYFTPFCDFHISISLCIFRWRLKYCKSSQVSWTLLSIIIYSFSNFSPPVLADFFSLDFERHKSPQLSRTLLIILSDLNHAAVWMVTTRPLISKSSSPRTNLWWLNQDHQLQLVSPSFSCSTIFFQFSGKVEVLIFLFIFFQFYYVVNRDCKVHYSASPFFLLTVTRSGCLAEIKWSVCISKS